MSVGVSLSQSLNENDGLLAKICNAEGAEELVSKQTSREKKKNQSVQPQATTQQT